MRTSTIRTVNGPVSANWALSHCSKSAFILELDERRRRHIALERLQEGLATLGFVPGLEGEKRRDGIAWRRHGRLDIRLGRMRAGMQRRGNRRQPVEQRPRAFAQFLQAVLDP